MKKLAITTVGCHGRFRGKVQWSNSHKYLRLVDSEVPLNPPLRQSANR